MGAQTRSGSPLPQDVVLPDRYRVVRRIAHGGMASVWCADDTALGRDVAIKLLAEQYAHDEAAVRRFKREARAAARLSGHPHVITIFDVGETVAAGDAPGGRPFIVMEHLSGGTVADAVRVGEVKRELTLSWLRQAAAALDYAHEQGVVHRDIKPGNLLLDRERRLHVADFGIARVAAEDTITVTGQLFGTAAYLSPEQALGKPASEAGDRYALAIVAYELLVGQRPFSAEHFASQARQHIEQEPPRASAENHELPEAVDAVLARGMAKRPQDRWPSAGAFVDALTRALRAQPRTAATRRSRGSPPAPPRRWRSRSREPRRAAPARRKPSPRAGALARTGRRRVRDRRDRRCDQRRQLVRPRPLRRPGRRSLRMSCSHTRPRRHEDSHAAAASNLTTPTTTSTTSTAATTTGVPASTPAPPPTADALEARGHQLMLDGQLPGGDQCAAPRGGGGRSGSSLTYAYALYDLGRSLRLAGNPQAAAVVLQRRLQIPNQTGVVRQELQLALTRDRGEAAAPSAQPAPGRPDTGTATLSVTAGGG